MWKQSLVRAIHKCWIFNRKKRAKLSCLRNINVFGPLKTIDYRTAFFRSLHMAVKPVSSLLICMPRVVSVAPSSSLEMEQIRSPWSRLLGGCCKTSHLKSNTDAQSLELTSKDIEEIEEGYDLDVELRIILSIGRIVDQLGQKMSRRWHCWGILIMWNEGTLLRHINRSLMLSGVDQYERTEGKVRRSDEHEEMFRMGRRSCFNLGISTSQDMDWSDINAHFCS
jgi:hypothetical protein